MFRDAARAAAVALNRYTPDPLVFALLLTLVCFGAAVLQGTLSAMQLVEVWGSSAKGIWSLLAFSMQMSLILVLGTLVARTRPVAWGLRALATIPNSARAATALVALVTTLCALLNWGMGLVVGALLAREVHQALLRRGVPVSGPALAAAGYSGMAVWHGGLSGSAPLKMTLEPDVVALLGPDLAARVGTLPLSATLGSTRNLLATVAAVGVCVVVLALLTPVNPTPEALTPEPEPEPEQGLDQAPLVRALERGPVLTLACGLLGLGWCAQYVQSQGLNRLDPNAVNAMLLTAALLLVGSPVALMRAASEAARACAGIIVQFPLYAGIMGLMVAGGLAERLVTWMPQDGRWVPLVTLLSAGLLNIAIPSGGGQFAVQGPVALEAAVRTGADPGAVVMAIAWGDQWTNLIQPFWALPLLGLTGRRAGELLGFTAPLCLALGLVFMLAAALP